MRPATVMTPPATLHALLTAAIDYAGLFPPAKVEMRDAVQRYARYRRTTDAWALGRFVLPLARLDELAMAQREIGADGEGWRLSVLLAGDHADGARIREFNHVHAGSALIDTAEARATGDPSEARRQIAMIARSLPPSVRLFMEIRGGPDIGFLVASIAEAGACAKVRTGGVTAEAFPSTGELARFLACCAERDVPFKATAGLHHPCRGEYPFTYEPDSPRGAMFGFLNVLVGAALARAGATVPDLIAILETEQPSEFRFGDEELSWRDTRVGLMQVLESHATFALSFGSCSFEEPIHDLRELGLL